MPPRTTELSEDALGIAYVYWNQLKTSELTFNRPRIIHTRMRAALNELTDIGYLIRTDDKSGSMTWRPTPYFLKVAQKIKLPDFKKLNFPATVDNGVCTPIDKTI